jgi:hypothetical protein
MRVLFGLLASACCAGALWCTADAEAQGASVPEPNPSTELIPAPAQILSEEPPSPSRDSLAHNAELLDELLSLSTEQATREQKFGAAAGITGGGILIGLSIWRLVEDPATNIYTRGLGVMFMTLGMADLTSGIYVATRIAHEKRRLERWKTARRNGITEIELAHFEGELQAAREMRQGERLLVRWNGLTHAIAGALVMSLTPVPDSSRRSDRVTGYVIGGVFMATGLAAFAASFRPTPSERAWDAYNARKIKMPGHELSWRVAPAISRRGAGLSFGARF